ncbi:MAG: PAS domain S-box protein [Acidobacteria bacterium]|nr:PAS domain S-box protein [Acidobacteriota bacterium]
MSSPPDTSGAPNGFATLIQELAKLVNGRREQTPSPLSSEQVNTSFSGPETLPSMEARHRVLVEQIPAVVFMAVVDGTISEVYVSPHIEQMLGFSREEWLDNPIQWYRQIHPDDRNRWSLEAAQLFLTGEPLKSVYRVIARDGRVVWFHCEAKLVRRADGRPWFIHGVGFDVTELKETERALQENLAEVERLQQLELEHQIAKTEQSESRLAAIVESSEDPIIGKTLDGTITSWNAAATRLFEYQPEEIVGRSVLLLVPPDLHNEETRILEELRAGKRIAQQESQRLTKGGRRVDVSLTISPIKNAAGQVIGGSTIARDITERKRSEEALRESEERFRTMAETAADGIFRIDEQSTILFANRAAEKIFGFSVEEMVGSPITVLIPDYLPRPQTPGIHRHLPTGSRPLDWERAEMRGRRKDGSEVALELSLGESSKDNKRLFTGFVRDVTERKQMEAKLRLTEKLAATGRLAATISHEINNPLAAITNFIYLARQDRSLSQQARQHLEGAARELKRVVHIARHTLGFYRDTTSPVKVNVAQLLADIVELYRSKIAYKNLRVAMRAQEGCEVLGLEGEIRQVFSNILANAIEASPDEGTLVLHVCPARQWNRQGRLGVRVSIADRGVGISLPSRSKIFEPFYSTKQNVGTGLGLWISKSLVEKHRGSIRFRSSVAPGRSGTVFSVFLPCDLESSSLSTAA